MNLRSRQETVLARPDADAIRAWLNSPVTEMFFNYVYRLDTTRPEPLIRDGFMLGKMTVLDSLLDFEEVMAPPRVVPEPPADYSVDGLLKQREAALGRMPKPKSDNPTA